MFIVHYIKTKNFSFNKETPDGVAQRVRFDIITYFLPEKTPTTANNSSLKLAGTN